MDSPSDPDVGAANRDGSRRPRCDPFQRLLSRHCVQAGSGRGDPVALCKRSRPGQSRELILGQPFPSSPLASVNSPVEVTVNGKPAEVLSAVGYPGAVDGYQVNFRVPPDTAKGSRKYSVKRRLDFRNCGGDRGSVNVGRTGAERNSHPGCNSTENTRYSAEKRCRSVADVLSPSTWAFDRLKDFLELFQAVIDLKRNRASVPELRPMTSSNILGSRPSRGCLETPSG